jgi:hypothetical protein
VVVALAIGSSVIVGLALLLSLVRTLERGWLMGACGSGDGEARQSALRVQAPALHAAHC